MFVPTQSPSEPVCSPHKSCPLKLEVFVPSTATEVPVVVANIAKQLTIQGSKLRNLKWCDFGFFLGVDVMAK